MKKMSLRTMLLLAVNIAAIAGMVYAVFGFSIERGGIAAVWAISAALLIWSVARDARDIPGKRQ